MTRIVDFAVRHGESIIFLYVFADQIGIPVPAVPGLLAVGALAAAGKINVALALVSSVCASLLADVIWYGLGRWRGSQVLRLLELSRGGTVVGVWERPLVRTLESSGPRVESLTAHQSKWAPGEHRQRPPMSCQRILARHPSTRTQTSPG